MNEQAIELEAGDRMLVVPIGQIGTAVGGLEEQPDDLTGVEVVCARVGQRPTMVQLRLAIEGGAQLVAVLTLEEAADLADILLEATDVEVIAPVLH